MTSTPSAPTVAGYTMLAKIGEGGMGVVHLARRENGDRVALKVLRPHIVGDDEARRRLEREVGSLSRVRSKWVAEIVDADPWAPVPYVATRYVPGLSLHDFVHEEGPITGADLTWFATCLAEGVASVHAVGVVHRDVKPSNVLMEGRTPILIDFGLARVADDPRLTHAGWLMGTPGYLPPEILHGDDATPASDVHSWAATVAYAATAQPPFGRGPTAAIMDRVRRGEHDLSGVPDPLRQLLAAALDPEPTQRPTLKAILGWLRPQVQNRTAPPPPPLRAVDDPFTMPLALASLGAAETDVLSDDPHTRMYTEPMAPEPTRTPLPERARRAGLLVAGGVVAGALVAAYPWFGSLALVLLVWVLRSGSLAASAAGDRRRMRGPKWYDGAHFLLRTPWDLVRSIPATFMLVLWSAGLSLAAALICYAFAAGESLTLFIAGAVFAAATWTGPGGSRVRSPLGRVVRPLSRSWKLWAGAMAVLVAVALGLGMVTESYGSSWAPGDDRPLSGPNLGHLVGGVAR